MQSAAAVLHGCRHVKHSRRQVGRWKVLLLLSGYVHL
jgi:hypothetical protein